MTAVPLGRPHGVHSHRRCYEVKTLGDRFMVVADCPTRAVAFALDVQRRLFACDWGTRQIDAVYQGEVLLGVGAGAGVVIWGGAGAGALPLALAVGLQGVCRHLKRKRQQLQGNRRQLKNNRRRRKGNGRRLEVDAFLKPILSPQTRSVASKSLGLVSIEFVLPRPGCGFKPARLPAGGESPPSPRIERYCRGEGGRGKCWRNEALFEGRHCR